jgi:hypothetical protein
VLRNRQPGNNQPVKGRHQEAPSCSFLSQVAAACNLVEEQVAVQWRPPGPSCTAPSLLLLAVGPSSTTAPNPETSTERRQVKLGFYISLEKIKKAQPLISKRELDWSRRMRGSPPCGGCQQSKSVIWEPKQHQPDHPFSSSKAPSIFRKGGGNKICNHE